MIEKMAGAPPGVTAVRASGWLLREDFDETVRPLVEDALRQGKGVRALIYVDDSFAGITPGAVLAGLSIGLQALRHWAGCAIIAPAWVRMSARIAGVVLGCPVRVFGVSDVDQAFSWLDGFGQRSGRPERGRAVPVARNGDRS